MAPSHMFRSKDDPSLTDLTMYTQHFLGEDATPLIVSPLSEEQQRRLRFAVGHGFKLFTKVLNETGNLEGLSQVVVRHEGVTYSIFTAPFWSIVKWEHERLMALREKRVSVKERIVDWVMGVEDPEEEVGRIDEMGDAEPSTVISSTTAINTVTITAATQGCRQQKQVVGNTAASRRSKRKDGEKPHLPTWDLRWWEEDKLV